MIAILSAPAVSARVEVLAPKGDEVLGEVHLLAGGVSDSIFAGKSTDDALDRLRTLNPTRFRIEQRLPNPIDGSLSNPGPETGTLDGRALAHLMRYCEDYVISCAIEVWRGNETARVEYRRGEISGVTVGGIDAPERLAEVMQWSSGNYRLIVPPFQMPATAPKRTKADKSADDAGPRPRGLRASGATARHGDEDDLWNARRGHRESTHRARGRKAGGLDARASARRGTARTGSGRARGAELRRNAGCRPPQHPASPSRRRAKTAPTRRCSAFRPPRFRKGFASGPAATEPAAPPSDVARQEAARQEAARNEAAKNEKKTGARKVGVPAPAMAPPPAAAPAAAAATPAAAAAAPEASEPTTRPGFEPRPDTRKRPEPSVTQRVPAAGQTSVAAYVGVGFAFGLALLGIYELYAMLAH